MLTTIEQFLAHLVRIRSSWSVGGRMCSIAVIRAYVIVTPDSPDSTLDVTLQIGGFELAMTCLHYNAHIELKRQKVDSHQCMCPWQ